MLSTAIGSTVCDLGLFVVSWARRSPTTPGADLTVPVAALDCECAAEVDACGRRWMVRVSGTRAVFFVCIRTPSPGSCAKTSGLGSVNNFHQGKWRSGLRGRVHCRLEHIITIYSQV